MIFVTHTELFFFFDEWKFLIPEYFKKFSKQKSQKLADVLLEIKELSSVYESRSSISHWNINIWYSYRFWQGGEIVIEKETTSLCRTEVEIISSAMTFGSYKPGLIYFL